MVQPVLSHRVVLNPEARMKGVTAEAVISSIMKNTAVPVKI